MEEGKTVTIAAVLFFDPLPLSFPWEETFALWFPYLAKVFFYFMFCLFILFVSSIQELYDRR